MEDMRHFFPGSNTSRGFYNRFAYIMPKEQVRRKIILKGGPGVGKNTFMHRVADYLLTNGRAVEFFHCSSDPDSLDGIAAPEIGFVMIDGTAPHVVDPVLPGAADGILNLGECLNEAMLEKNVDSIRAASDQISRCFLRTYDYLSAAAPLMIGINRQWRERTPPGSMEALARTLIGKYLTGEEGFATERELFAEAYTPKGYISFLPTLLSKRVVCIDSPWGFSPHPLLARLRDAALDRGIPVLGLYNPLLPGELNHLNFPSLSMSVVTSPVDKQSETVDLKEALSLNQAASKEQVFNRKIYEQLIQRAVESLRDAKRRHDDLEKWYVAAMDYGLWEKALDKVKTTIGIIAGAL
jgi:hypothetical protein